MRRAVTTLVVVVVGAIVVPVARPMPDGPAAASTTAANPPIDDPTGNPFVLGWGQLSYAYVDGHPGDTDGERRENVPAYASGDLATWHAVGDVLPDDRLGAWMGTGPLDLVTAPAVAAYPGNPDGARFVLWFTATDAASGRRCIGVATAAAPGGPFTAAGEPLLCPGDGDGDAGDPSPVPVGSGARPGAGPAQLVFRLEGDRPGVYAVRLAPDGRSVATAPRTPLLLDDSAGTVSRPSVLRVAGDHALLLFSSTTDVGIRSIGWARCSLAAGRQDVTGCTAVPGAHQWIVGNETVTNPGAPQMFGEPGDRWLAYDAFAPGACAVTPTPSATPGSAAMLASAAAATVGCTSDRRMHVDKLCLDETPAGAATGDGTADAPAGAGTIEPAGTGSGPAATVAGSAGAGSVAVPRTSAPSAGEHGTEREPGCREDVARGWVATWAAGAMPVSEQFGEPAAGFADQTLRQVVHTSVGGEAVRVRLSNAHGTVPLHVGRAAVGVAAEAAGSTPAVRPGTDRPLTFGGRPGVVVPPGGDVLSDAVALAVPPDHDLAVSLWFPRPTGPPSGHLIALETSHIGPGDLVDDPGPGFAGATTTTSSFYVSAVDVLVDEPPGTVVLLGDSLTDGAGGGEPDAEGRWSDVVVDRLAAEGPLRRGVVNLGIAGNPLLPDPRSTSPSGLERFDRDVLAQAGVGTVVVLLGTNDLLGVGSSAPAVIDGLRQLITRAHAAGVRIVGVTIPPFSGPHDDTPRPAAAEQARTAINERIRAGAGGTGGGLAFDAVVDMDAALRDPLDPRRVRSPYGWFGGFHPSDAGHRAMGEAIDLDVLAPASEVG